MEFTAFVDAVKNYLERAPSRVAPVPMGSGVCAYFLDTGDANSEKPCNLIQEGEHIAPGVWHGRAHCHAGFIGLRKFANVAFCLMEYGYDGVCLPKAQYDKYFDLLLNHPLYTPLLKDSIRYRPNNQDPKRPVSWLFIPYDPKTIWILGQFAVATRFTYETRSRFKLWVDLVENHGADPWKALVMHSALSKDSNGTYTIYPCRVHGTPTDVIPMSGFMKIAEERYAGRSIWNEGSRMSREAFWGVRSHGTSDYYVFQSYGPIMEHLEKVNKSLTVPKKIVVETIKSRFGAIRERAESEDQRATPNNRIVHLPGQFVNLAYDTITNGAI